MPRLRPRVTQRKVTPVTIPRLPRSGRGAEAGHRERIAQRQAKAITLRTAGASFKQIGEHLGVSAMQAHRDTMTALAAVVAQRNEDAAQLRTLELERLDRLTSAMWPKASAGSAEHARALVRISERRCRLLGLDAQVQAKLELIGRLPTPAPLPVGHHLAALTDEQLVERLTSLREQLVTPVQSAPAAPAVVTPEEAYAAELERRAAEWPTTH